MDTESFEAMLTGGHPNSLNQTMKTLGSWAKEDPALKAWLMPHLERLREDGRKSVAKTASKTLHSLTP